MLEGRPRRASFTPVYTWLYTNTGTSHRSSPSYSGQNSFFNLSVVATMLFLPMLLALAGVPIAHDLALFQDIELDMVIAAPGPTYSMNQGQSLLMYRL